MATDHKPLLGIFNDRALDKISNPRVQCLKERTVPWRFTIIHCPGKWNKGPDALSRHPTKVVAALQVLREPVSSDVVMQCCDVEDAPHVASIYALHELGSITLDHVVSAAQSDEECQAPLKVISSGFPEKRNFLEPACLRKYWEVRHRLSIFRGIALVDKWLVIPLKPRNTVLSNLHSANQGTTGMKFRAHQCGYWPGMDISIQIHRDNCLDCLRHAPFHCPEPIILTPSPSYPFQQICADYFEITGHSYLTIVDCFSGWICIYALKAHEVRHQTLQRIFRNLFIAYGVIAYGNGRAEVAVKAAKRITHNNCSPDGGIHNDKAARAILQYRSTPLPNIALSPAQILLHRQLRDSIPAHPAHYKPHKEWVLTAEEREKTLSNRNHLIVKNQNAKARELTPLPLGTNVVVQGDGKKWECTGNIVEVLPHRQYRIRMFHSGRVVLRNRRFLREYSTVTPPVIRPLPAIIPENSTADNEVPSPDTPVTLDPTRLAHDTPDNNTTQEVDPVPEQTVS